MSGTQKCKSGLEALYVAESFADCYHAEGPKRAEATVTTSRLTGDGRAWNLSGVYETVWVWVGRSQRFSRRRGLVAFLKRNDTTRNREHDSANGDKPCHILPEDCATRRPIRHARCIQTGLGQIP